MTKQQLKAHCEDVIANPQDHLDWVVDMARVALASLEAVPVAYADSQAFINFSSGVAGKEWMWARNDAGLQSMYTSPPVAELKPIELGAVTYCQDGKPWFTADEVISAIRAAGCEVKS